MKERKKERKEMWKARKENERKMREEGKMWSERKKRNVDERRRKDE